ncbi:hypothetical protein DFH09DRAFT_1325814 [Mycena vulgaris]|nr:hypothetical protein DFH09DRAFT_1325814 [Mycena vulgaris]
MWQLFDFTHPLFHTISHLEAFDDDLTHFAFRIESERFLEIVADTILPACPRLHCLVLLNESTYWITAAARMTCERLATDPRFDAMSLVDFARDLSFCLISTSPPQQRANVDIRRPQISVDHRSLGLQD